MRRPPPRPESPLVRLLRDPAGELHHLLALIQHALAQAVPYLGAVAGLALALTLALWLLPRLLQGQPHVSWEIAADRAGSAFRLWLPRAIPPGLVERALLSAWPGASLQEEDAAPTTSGEQTFVCCELRLSGPPWRLLGGSEGTDPLRLVLGQLAGLEREERAL